MNSVILINKKSKILTLITKVSKGKLYLNGWLIINHSRSVYLISGDSLKCNSKILFSLQAVSALASINKQVNSPFYFYLTYNDYFHAIPNHVLV